MCISISKPSCWECPCTPTLISLAATERQETQNVMMSPHGFHVPKHWQWREEAGMLLLAAATCPDWSDWVEGMVILSYLVNIWKGLWCHQFSWMPCMHKKIPFYGGILWKLSFLWPSAKHVVNEPYLLEITYTGRFFHTSNSAAWSIPDHQ